ncbi:bifunctional phosphoribosyl-AMP cyclohydrolase/phosphoribosyl-ATP diphosphatase HisIE [Croceiramulus getboli]|nr:bifunctional phosphoribosyl-AMP cyclohydrolase/phosphoribosyl-ATP diphosphatase HisIE [Flavobacteriaceae bacterium YJPT1-3]
MNLKFNKDGLIPAIIQDAQTHVVLMLGYMNQEAYDQTIATGRVTFYSRSKQRLWTKGEESGNFLEVVQIQNDCDQDSLLIQANPAGPVCHTGSDTCWDNENTSDFGFLSQLEAIIERRKEQAALPLEERKEKSSYVVSLFDKGINKIAQKVGEEAIETVIEAKDDNESLFLNESADLLFHYLILLQAKGYQLSDIVAVLKERHR